MSLSRSTSTTESLPPYPEIEGDGFINVHPQVNPHRGSASEDFDPRTIRHLLAEITDLEADDIADPHAPLWREMGQKGSYWWTTDHPRRRAIALYGITAAGWTDTEAAAAWITAACTALTSEEGAL